MSSYSSLKRQIEKSKPVTAEAQQVLTLSKMEADKFRIEEDTRRETMEGMEAALADEREALQEAQDDMAFVASGTPEAIKERAQEKLDREDPLDEEARAMKSQTAFTGNAVASGSSQSESQSGQDDDSNDDNDEDDSSSGEDGIDFGEDELPFGDSASSPMDDNDEEEVPVKKSASHGIYSESDDDSVDEGEVVDITDMEEYLGSSSGENENYYETSSSDDELLLQMQTSGEAKGSNPFSAGKLPEVTKSENSESEKSKSSVDDILATVGYSAKSDDAEEEESVSQEEEKPVAVQNPAVKPQTVATEVKKEPSPDFVPVDSTSVRTLYEGLVIPWSELNDGKNRKIRMQLLDAISMKYGIDDKIAKDNLLMGYLIAKEGMPLDGTMSVPNQECLDVAAYIINYDKTSNPAAHLVNGIAGSMEENNSKLMDVIVEQKEEIKKLQTAISDLTKLAYASVVGVAHQAMFDYEQTHTECNSSATIPFDEDGIKDAVKGLLKRSGKIKQDILHDSGRPFR